MRYIDRSIHFFRYVLIAIFFVIGFLVPSLFDSGNKVFAADLVAEAGPNQAAAVNQQVDFDAFASTGSIVSYLWDFGDGSSAGVINPSHIYTSMGSFTVTLTVSDNIGGNSTDTLTVIVTPLALILPPFNLTAYGGDNTVALSWDENSEPDLAGYNVYRSQIPGGPYTRINGSVLVDTSYSDSAVSNGTTYYYVVTAEDTSSNESVYSNEVPVTPSLTGPTVVGGSMSGNNTWTLSTGPYQVTGNITVSAGASLDIEPGVLIEFDSGITMDIQGSLNVMGTASKDSKS